MKEKLRNLFDEMKVRSRYKSMNAIIDMIEKRIAERMPSEEEVLQYFNNHFDCYADAEHVEIAMTNTAVLKLIWWFRNRMEGKA